MRRVAAFLGIDELRLGRRELLRLLILTLTAAACATMVVDYARTPTDKLSIGDIAQNTLKAPFAFSYPDHSGRESTQIEAKQTTPPLFVYRTDLLAERESRIRSAFEHARQALHALPIRDLVGEEENPEISTKRAEYFEVLKEQFISELKVQIPREEVQALLEEQFSPELEALAIEFLQQGMKDRFIVLNRDAIPADRSPITMMTVHPDGNTEITTITDLERIVLPSDARNQVSLALIERKRDEKKSVGSAAVIARSLITANVTFDLIQTEQRKEEAAAKVPLELKRVKAGEAVLHGGEKVTERQLEQYRALQEHLGEADIYKEIVSVTIFIMMLLTALYTFAVGYLADFTTRLRHVAAAASLLVLSTLLTRIVVSASAVVASLVGFEAQAGSVWFLIPIAGCAMLVRTILGISWTVVYILAAPLIASLALNLGPLHTAFLTISAVAGVTAIEQSRERLAVLKAGFAVGVFNAATVLVIHLVQLFVVEAELSMATTMRPFWSMIFGFSGGILSAFLVLGLVPLFEAAGFVTDYRLLELANLNHPLLRQLMLRAPGSYHHSVVVGTLAEAGAESVGANALLAKVASYFHDIGKASKPLYFVENQQGVSKHINLDPYTSAKIIISHVTDGGRMAMEHGLPKPILDNIYMHHGTGILQYFYASARAAAADPDDINPDDFRYSGPKPNTREAGIIMLADKVEAATRTLKNPDANNLRQMINRITASVISDNQLSECPLTFQEINVINDVFVKVLVGIYHQRIEYPDTADLSKRPASSGRTNTLEIELEMRQVNVRHQPQANQQARAEAVELQSEDDGEYTATFAGPQQDRDYEAVDYLPRKDV